MLPASSVREWIREDFKAHGAAHSIGAGRSKSDLVISMCPEVPRTGNIQGNGRESKYKVYRVKIISLMFVDLSMFKDL